MATKKKKVTKKNCSRTRTREGAQNFASRGAPKANIMPLDCIKLEVEGGPVEQVSNFVYLGATISGGRTIDRVLDARIQIANGAFQQLWKIWNSSSTIKTPTNICI